MIASFSEEFYLNYDIFFVYKIKKGALLSHDSIAQKDFYPHLPDIPVEMDEDEESVKIVQLVKSNEPLVCICK